jgi:hypothetical protein
LIATVTLESKPALLFCTQELNSEPSDPLLVDDCQSAMSEQQTLVLQADISFEAGNMNQEL